MFSFPTALTTRTAAAVWLGVVVVAGGQDVSTLLRGRITERGSGEEIEASGQGIAQAEIVDSPEEEEPIA